jgi:hypothetical protein
LTSRSSQPNAFVVAANPMRGLGLRVTWSGAISRPIHSKGEACRGLRISRRADSKLAPCMVRPNLFSGD